MNFNKNVKIKIIGHQIIKKNLQYDPITNIVPQLYCCAKQLQKKKVFIKICKFFISNKNGNCNLKEKICRPEKFAFFIFKEICEYSELEAT